MSKPAPAGGQPAMDHGGRAPASGRGFPRPSAGGLHLVSAEEHRRLLTLVRVGYEINASLELDDVLHLILEHGMEAVDAEAGTFWLVEGDRVTPRAVKGPKAEAVRRASLRPGEGLVGEAIRTRSGLLVEDVRRHPTWASHVDRSAGYRTETLLCVPLENRGQVLGALQFVNKRHGRRFRRADLRLAEALARQAGLTLANSLLFEQTQRLGDNLIRALIAAVEACDASTAGHSQRVSQYVAALAAEVGLSREACREAAWAGLLHDVGKVGVLPLILRKPGRLDSAEVEQVRTHVQLGADMIDRLDASLNLQPVAEAIRYHHEWYDGSGYLSGLRGEDIPLLARMIAIADAFDVMTSERPYSAAVGRAEALHEIQAAAGSQFDPALAAAFIAAAEQGRLSPGEPAAPPQPPRAPRAAAGHLGPQRVAPPAGRTPAADPNDP